MATKFMIDELLYRSLMSESIHFVDAESTHNLYLEQLNNLVVLIVHEDVLFIIVLYLWNYFTLSPNTAQFIDGDPSFIYFQPFSRGDHLKLIFYGIWVLNVELDLFSFVPLYSYHLVWEVRENAGDTEEIVFDELSIDID